MSKLKKNPHWGSTLDEFLDEAPRHDQSSIGEATEHKPRQKLRAPAVALYPFAQMQRLIGSRQANAPNWGMVSAIGNE